MHPLVRPLRLLAAAFCLVLPAAGAGLVAEFGSAPGLSNFAWQSSINHAGSATANATSWSLASGGAYTGVQLGVSLPSPALLPDDRLVLTVRRPASGHSATTLRLVLFSADWSRSNAYDFDVSAPLLNSQIFTPVESLSTVGSPAASSGGGLRWGTDPVGALQFIVQQGGSPALQLELRNLSAIAATPVLGSGLASFGQAAPRLAPQNISPINGGSLATTPASWQLAGSGPDSGAQFALVGDAHSLATTGLDPASTLVLRLRPRPGHVATRLRVELLNAAWSRGSIFEFDLAGLTPGRSHDVPACTPLGSPLANTGGGLQLGQEAIAGIKLLSASSGTLALSLDRLSVARGEEFREWRALRLAAGIAAPGPARDQDLLAYATGLAPRAPAPPAFASSLLANDRVGLSFLRDPRRADLRLVVEGSDELAAWSPLARAERASPFLSLGAHAIEAPAGRAAGPVTVWDAALAPPRRFLRLRAERLAPELRGGEEVLGQLHHSLGEVALGRLYRAEPQGLPTPVNAPSLPAWEPEPWQNGDPAATGALSPFHPLLKYTGRILPSAWSPFVEFTWSGTQIEAVFTGPSVAIELEGNEHYFNIVLNGDYHAMRTVRVKGRRTITLAENLGAGPHHLLVFNRVSVLRGLAKFHALHLAPGHGLQPPAPRPARRIEFVGDSITAGQVVGFREGYGGSESGEHHDKDNAFLAYAALGARALGAEAHYIAWPGIAMAAGRGYTNTAAPVAWTKTAPMNWDVPNSPAWDFARWQPQLVVVNLLQNDMSVGGADTNHLSRDAYVAFLKEVRQRYGPDIRILCVAGNMSLSSSATWKQVISDAVAIFQTDTGHAGVGTLFFPFKGSPGHPRVSEQQAMADALVPAIRQRMGW